MDLRDVHAQERGRLCQVLGVRSRETGAARQEKTKNEVRPLRSELSFSHEEIFGPFKLKESNAVLKPIKIKHNFTDALRAPSRTSPVPQSARCAARC